MKQALGYIVIALTLFSCAQIVPLTGGEEDNNPPILQQAVPENYSTRFNSRGIMLEFDEYFKFDSRDVSVNPGLTTQPQFRTKGKRIYIELGDDLEPNTTYSINFGNAIRDVAEGNIRKNFKYVFSTGEFIDSLEYRGNVVSAKEGIPVKDAVVGLYRNLDSLAPYTTQPNYVGITNEKGWFSIENIKEGTYQVFALSDENGNYQYEETTESIGFLDHEVVLDTLSSDASMVELAIFRKTPEKLVCKDKTGYKEGYGRLVFNRPLDQENFQFLQPEKVEEVVWSAHHDSLVFYTKYKVDRADFILTQPSGTKDTVKLDMRNTLAQFQLSKPIVTHDHREPLPLKFNTIIKQFYEEDFDLLQDSTRLPITLSIDQKHPNQLYIWASLEPNSSYTVKLDSASIMDAVDRGVKPAQFSFKTHKENYFGNLVINVITSKLENIFIDLIDEKGQVVRTSDSFYGANAIHFDDLPPGKYTARLVYDVNFNNRWDTGDYMKKLQPERVVNMGRIIDVRTNWSLNEDWYLEGKPDNTEGN